jgi:hypothetical protein
MSTSDTPDERDAKAEVLEDKRHARAAALAEEAEITAREFRRFKWEVRGYYLVVFVVLALPAFQKVF